MDANEKLKAPLRVRYEYEQEQRPQLKYAHGVWGGINPQGEVELNFYTESDKIPPYSESIIAADGTLGHEICPGDENLKVIVRNIHSRLVLSPSTARAVLEWLEEKVEALEAEADSSRLFLEDAPDMEQ